MARPVQGADRYHIENISFWSLHSAQTESLSEGHPVIFSPSSVIIPFPPRERKDWNNPAEIYGSPGARLLCRNKWKTRAAVTERDTARSRVSRPHGARPIDTDTAHYMSRLYGDQSRSVVWDTQRVWFTGEIVGRTLFGSPMTAVMKYSVRTCNCVMWWTEERRGDDPSWGTPTLPVPENFFSPIICYDFCLFLSS